MKTKKIYVYFLNERRRRVSESPFDEASQERIPVAGLNVTFLGTPALDRRRLRVFVGNVPAPVPNIDGDGSQSRRKANRSNERRGGNDTKANRPFAGCQGAGKNISNK